MQKAFPGALCVLVYFANLRKFEAAKGPGQCSLEVIKCCSQLHELLVVVLSWHTLRSFFLKNIFLYDELKMCALKAKKCTLVHRIENTGHGWYSIWCIIFFEIVFLQFSFPHFHCYTFNPRGNQLCSLYFLDLLTYVTCLPMLLACCSYS